MGRQRISEVLEEFLSLPERDVQAEYLIETADRFREVPNRIATRPFDLSHRVPGCESEAYAWSEPASGDTLKFYFAVENPQGISAKALCVLLDESLSGASLDEVRAVDPEIVYTLFGRGISLGKGQGLMGIVNKVKSFVKS